MVELQSTALLVRQRGGFKNRLHFYYLTIACVFSLFPLLNFRISFIFHRQPSCQAVVLYVPYAPLFLWEAKRPLCVVCRVRFHVKCFKYSVDEITFMKKCFKCDEYLKGSLTIDDNTLIKSCASHSDTVDPSQSEDEDCSANLKLASKNKNSSNKQPLVGLPTSF